MTNETYQPENSTRQDHEVILSTRRLPYNKQFDLCRDVMNKAIAPIKLELERPGEEFTADMLLRSFGSLQLSYAASNTKTDNLVKFTHGRSEIACTAEHSLVLSYRLSEEASLSYNHVASTRIAGNWVLLSTEDRISGYCHRRNARHVMVRIPTESNASLVALSARIVGMPQFKNNIMNALVSDYVWTLVSQPMPGKEQSAVIGQHFVDLLTLALNQTKEQFEASENGVRAALLAAIAREIEVHYLDHDFTPAQAASTLGITTRYLHKILEASNMTFSKRVMQRRLQHAQELLVRSFTTKVSILDVALESGFSNAEHFSQRFRRAFGVRPREFRESHKYKGKFR